MDLLAELLDVPVFDHGADEHEMPGFAQEREDLGQDELVFAVVDGREAEEDLPVHADADLLAEIGAGVFVEGIVVHAVRDVDGGFAGVCLLRANEVGLGGADDAVARFEGIGRASPQAVEEVAVAERTFQRLVFLTDLRRRGRVEEAALHGHDAGDPQEGGGSPGGGSHTPDGVAVDQVEFAGTDGLHETGNDGIAALAVEQARLVLGEREDRITVGEPVNGNGGVDLVLHAGKSIRGENLGGIAVFLKRPGDIPDDRFRTSPFGEGETADDLSSPHDTGSG